MLQVSVNKRRRKQYHSFRVQQRSYRYHSHYSHRCHNHHSHRNQKRYPRTFSIQVFLIMYMIPRISYIHSKRRTFIFSEKMKDKSLINNIVLMLYDI
jgi:hypothetical protein